MCVRAKRRDASGGGEEGSVGERNKWGQTGREGKHME